ncbi:hypothetical protein DH2020_016905 [Rehmannia glutinosa]|uniref:RRM domain-containing protein n=1 Tax=Rehmannia glutinosa TaxID=99300 RepID=A0ABR0WT67_REHGL
MEMDQGKLFIGGISWDTNEDRLKEYFGAYGEVVEAVIMRDRTTGRARGFGFVVFANPADAERVVKEKHMIDGRTVEAKKAVPRDDQHLISRSSGSIQGSPGPGRTKKIFVGGLASTVTENDFKNYFDQFGTIMDVVVMYDHNTQRPRGFGFITYDSEDAVDRVLHKTFHELNGKMVEVKRAVPKEMSPGPTRSPLVGFNYGFSRANNFLNNYGQGYNLSSVGGYGVRMDGRYNQLASGRAGFSHFGSPAYGMGVNMEQGIIRLLVTMQVATEVILFSTHHPEMYGEMVPLIIIRRITWAPPYFGSGNSGFGVFGNNGTIGALLLLRRLSEEILLAIVGNFGYRGGENSYALGAGGFGRNNTTGVATTSSFAASSGDYEGSYGDFYRGGSVYGDPTWQTTSSELDNSGSFGYGLGNSEDVTAKDSEDYVVGYDIPNRQSSRGAEVHYKNAQVTEANMGLGSNYTCSERAAVSRDFVNA